jgi:ABC-type cobalamin/Fe3+-siderophores transport system ATPase subunit
MSDFFDATALTGHNGSGKSRLLKVLARRNSCQWQHEQGSLTLEAPPEQMIAL